MVGSRHPPISRGPSPLPPVPIRAALVTAVALVVTLPPLLVPVFPAGDLHSHVFNAWLARGIAAGRLPGLSLAPSWTNAGIDRALEALLCVAPPRVAEAVVLISLGHLLVWSAFAFCRALSGRACWEWLPALTMLGLGWSFHMGFTNWSASAGLSLVAGARALTDGRWRWPLALGTLAIAIPFNPLPPAWIAVAVALAVCARRGWRPWTVLGCAVAAAGGGGALLVANGRARYDLAQWTSLTGADQAWVFDQKYALFMLALLLAWGLAFLALPTSERWSPRPALVVASFASACALVVPDAVVFPGYRVAFSFLVVRSSLFAGIAWTAAVACAPPSRTRACAISLVAAAWLATLAVDWRGTSAVVSRMAALAASLPAGARVVSTLTTPPERASRVQPFTHAADFACTGQCFAWGNYEPSSGAFRVRTERENDFVVSRRSDFWAIEQGGYLVPTHPAPLWKLHPCPGAAAPEAICASEAIPGERLSLEPVDPFAGHSWARASFARGRN